MVRERKSLSESDSEAYLKPVRAQILKYAPKFINTSDNYYCIPSTSFKNASTNQNSKACSSKSDSLKPDSDSMLKELYESYLLDEQNITFGDLLGTGHFGYVQFATYKTDSINLKIAIKKLQNKSEKKAMLKEIQILSTCKHENVVTFLGFTEQQNGHLCIVTEFMAGGDLRTYLENPEMPLTVEKVFSYIFQVVEGMTYLCHKKILHRDLAARNCLLNETYNILKITDFGLSKIMDINYEYVSHGNPELPVKILPIEELLAPDLKYKTITFRGDIWALGILIWEIFERGGKMYAGMTLSQLTDYLNSGKRLPCPKHCPKKLYDLMRKCWDQNPKNRPIFDLLKVNIKQIYDEIKGTVFSCLNDSIEISDTYSRVNVDYSNPTNDIKPYPTYNGFYIFIKGSNGKLMSGENGLRPLKCDRKEPNVWEMFTIENFGNGIVALKSKDNYVSSENGEKPVTCDRKVISETEKFEWIDNSEDGTFSLKGNNGKFLTRDNGEGLMICNSEVNGIFEKFTYIDYFDIPFVETKDTVDGPHTFIKGSNGRYVCSEDGYNPMKCDRESPDGWERFNIEDLGDGFVALKCNGKYVTSELGERPMWCNRATINDWEKFEIINHSDEKFSLKGGNNFFVTVSPKNQLMFCDGKSLKDAEKFSFSL